jgi:hypothetical protein
MKTFEIKCVPVLIEEDFVLQASDENARLLLGPWEAQHMEMDSNGTVILEILYRWSFTGAITVMEERDDKDRPTGLVVMYRRRQKIERGWYSREAADRWLLAHGWTLDVDMRTVRGVKYRPKPLTAAAIARPWIDPRPAQVT